MFDNPFTNLDEYLTPREQYIQEYRNGAVSTYALLKDGQWYEKGEMGWFGMSSDKMTDQEWAIKVGELLDGLSDDGRLGITIIGGMILSQVLTLYTTPAEVYRALIEGTAYGALTIINRFEEYGVKVEQIINCGGIAEKNPVVMQILQKIR